MSELPPGVEPAEPPTPRPSASGIVLDRDEAGWRVLLARRSRRSRFMPGHLAFPGGAVDPEDRPDEPGAYARTVARELAEEAAFVAGEWFPAGERTTPPIFPVRFHTAFFVAEAREWRPPAEPPSPEELESLEMLRADAVVAAWAAGEAAVPPPVLPLLRTIAAHDASDLDTLVAALTEANRLEQRAPRIEFVPEVYMLPVRTATLPPASHTNVWIPGRERSVVIDPAATDPDERARLREVLRRIAAKPRAVLVTHEHQDHGGDAVGLARELGVPLLAHPLTLEALRQEWGLADVDARELTDGETIAVDDDELVALHTPGHSPGHLSFHWEARKLAFTGDLLSGLSTIVVLPGQGDMGDYLASLERIRTLGAKTLLPGHGPPLPARALKRLIEHRLQREARIVAALGTERKSLGDLARAAYEDYDRLPPALTESQTLAHLLWLEKKDEAVREDDVFRHWKIGPVAASSTLRTIERILRDRFEPSELTIKDDSAKHAGHPGASSGGGHYDVEIVSARFAGKSRLDQHRMVNEALAELFGERIHALALKTRAG